MNKEKLWLRYLSCGHIRPTNVAFMFNKYDKPKKENCYCRVCCQDVNIIRIEQADNKHQRDFKKFVKGINRGLK